MEVSRLFMPDDNIIKADHRALKGVIRPTHGFQKLKTANATIPGVEVMRMIHHGQRVLTQSGTIGEIHFINPFFGLAA
ncbi:DDE-type integrase/transposase/recombinase [Microvirga sp. TS319]|uniref:DDE-type integrase/transposase/recombinase n=1 Tax=Microvirga sp. TS319 TaxID=3241165 RepID=UPI00351AA9A4